MFYIYVTATEKKNIQNSVDVANDLNICGNHEYFYIHFAKFTNCDTRKTEVKLLKKTMRNVSKIQYTFYIYVIKH